MVTQVPPIMIDGNVAGQEGTMTFDPRFHNKQRDTGSVNHGARVQFVLWPLMYESDSKRVISKGEVVV